MIIDYNSWPYFNCYEFCFQYRIETIYAYFSLPPDWSIVFWEYRQVNVLNITGKQAPVFHAPWPAGRQLGWRRPTDSCYSYYMYQVNTMLHLVIWLFHFSFSWSRVGSIQLSSPHVIKSNISKLAPLLSRSCSSPLIIIFRNIKIVIIIVTLFIIDMISCCFQLLKLDWCYVFEYFNVRFKNGVVPFQAWPADRGNACIEHQRRRSSRCRPS